MKTELHFKDERYSMLHVELIGELAEQQIRAASETEDIHNHREEDRQGWELPDDEETIKESLTVEEASDVAH